MTSATRFAILGWGSLLWDRSEQFESFWQQIEGWRPDGPTLPLEFSRVSESRGGALTLVVDPQHGRPCRVAYALSRRRECEEAISDLRRREGTVRKRIGWFGVDDVAQVDQSVVHSSVRVWAVKVGLAGVVWTALETNFAQEVGKPFTVEAAVDYVQSLGVSSRRQAADYVWRAPDFVQTPVRTALQALLENPLR